MTRQKGGQSAEPAQGLPERVSWFDFPSLRKPINYFGHHLEFNKMAADQSSDALREFLRAIFGDKLRQRASSADSKRRLADLETENVASLRRSPSPGPGRPCRKPRRWPNWNGSSRRPARASKTDGGGKPRMGGGQREPRHDLQGGPSQAEEGVSPGPRARHSHPGALGAYHAFAHPKDTKSRRSERPLLDRASTYVPPTWQNGTRCRFASSQAQLSSWPNPHSTRGAAAARIPRFRALALFGRRPLERVDSPAIPASENLHKLGSQAAV